MHTHAIIHALLHVQVIALETAPGLLIFSTIVMTATIVAKKPVPQHVKQPANRGARPPVKHHAKTHVILVALMVVIMDAIPLAKVHVTQLVFILAQGLVPELAPLLVHIHV